MEPTNNLNLDPFANIMATVNDPTMLFGQFQHILYGGMKVVLLIFLFIYTIIALFTIKQIGLMTHTLKMDSNKYIYLIGYIHLIAVLICLVFTLTAL